MNNLPQVPNNSFCGDFAPPEQLRGYTAKWDKEKNWHDGSDGLPLPSPLLVIGTDTLLVRWHPQREEIRDKPLPSAAMLNSAIPRSEWREGLNGEPEPPWKLNYEIRMIDPVGGKLYTYCNSTFGGSAAGTAGCPGRKDDPRRNEAGQADPDRRSHQRFTPALGVT
jgi:hypothetical protein